MQETKTTKIYHNIKESSKSWKWKGKTLFYVVFITTFSLSAFLPPILKQSENLYMQSFGTILFFSIFIQFILFCDLKTTMSFYSIKNAVGHEKPKGFFQRLDNCKCWIKKHFISESESDNKSLFLFYSFITLVLMLSGMNKVFTLMDKPSLLNLLHLFI